MKKRKLQADPLPSAKAVRNHLLLKLLLLVPDMLAQEVTKSVAKAGKPILRAGSIMPRVVVFLSNSSSTFLLRAFNAQLHRTSLAPCLKIRLVM